MNNLLALLLVLSLGLFVNTNSFDKSLVGTENKPSLIYDCEINLNKVTFNEAIVSFRQGLGCGLLSNCNGTATCNGTGQMLGPCTIICDEGEEIRCGEKKDEEIGFL